MKTGTKWQPQEQLVSGALNGEGARLLASPPWDSEPATMPQNGLEGQGPVTHDAVPSDQARSCWETDGATPMISRPHFAIASGGLRRSPSLHEIWHPSPVPLDLEQPQHRRRRSQSLGSAPLESKYRSLLPSSVPIAPLLRTRMAVSAAGPSDRKPLAAADEAAPLDRAAPPDAAPRPAVSRSQVQSQSVWICAMYGVVNATIVLPVLISFASIIYRDPFFSPYMPVLVKLTLVSGIVHQLCFCAVSSLPFAIGQVQDAGLIFLSNMASNMVRYGRDRGHSDDRILATVTVVLGLGTALLGGGLVLVGRLRLAQYVRALPTCVIGGYLAYIGWFCGAAGVGLMAGGMRASAAPRALLRNADLIAPGLVGGALIYAAVRRFQHMAVLPTIILLLLALFYLVLWLRGASIESVTRDGWIRTMDQPPPLLETWKYLRLDRVDWSVLPHLVSSELGMIFIVAISSSLDVAAIELELNEPLDYNHELITVGVSNVVSGMTGGYTGSYIFSQSIFSLRAGIRSRVAGIVLALCQVIVLVLPFPLLRYVPNFFFGSLLTMICIDLMYEWLWDVRTTITLAEYLISLTTFVMIQLFDVELGILLGVALYFSCYKSGVNVGNLKNSAPPEAEALKKDQYGSI